VRDLETAELAIRTALTGHLVFSTLHTNDAPSGVTRLLDMGMEPYLVASSVQIFIAQRLVRTICPECKEKVTLKEVMKDIKETPKETIEVIERPEHIFRGKGCDACKFTGYRGRVAIYEILPITEKVRQLIVDKASATQIKKVAIEAGMRSLTREGWAKIAAGLTTPEEVMRVTELT